MHPTPSRILIVRADTYGDWILTEPLIRLMQERFPRARIALLLRADLADIAPLLGVELQVLIAPFNPHRGIVPANDPVLLDLQAKIASFDPEWLVAPAFNRTWFERWAARCCPRARRMGLAGNSPDSIALAAEERSGHPGGKGDLEEEILVNEGSPEREKLAELAQVVLGATPANHAHLDLKPDDPTTRLILEGMGLPVGGFVACAPAGVANVSIKAWPAAHFAQVIAWLAHESGLPVLLCAHEQERGIVDEVCRAAGQLGVSPKSWLGQDGSFAVLAQILAHSCAFFGNDTGSMHAAAATGRPTLGIFGGGTWPRFQPRGQGPTASAVQPLECFGCGWKCSYVDAPCLRSLPVATVKRALTWLLSAGEGENRIFEVRSDEGLSPDVREFIHEREKARSFASPPPLAEFAARLEKSELDRAERLGVIEAQGKRLSALEAEMDRSIRDFAGRLAASEADRAKRLAVIERQGNEVEAARRQATVFEHELSDLRAHYDAAEADRAARLVVIKQLGASLDSARQELSRLENERALLYERYNFAEADRAARLLVIERQGASLDSARQELSRLENERDSLYERYNFAEADRAARLAVIEKQGVELGESFHKLSILENRTAELSSQLVALQRHFSAAEADRAARLVVIERQGGELGAAAAELAHQRQKLMHLEESRLARFTRRLGMWPS